MTSADEGVAEIHISAALKGRDFVESHRQARESMEYLAYPQAGLVATIPMKPPAPSIRTRTGRKTGRQALELLAKNADVYAEATLLAYGWFEVRRLQNQ